MIVIGLILSVFGIGFLCWLLFTLAVYALPVLRRHDGGSGRLSQRFRRHRRACRGVRCGSGHLVAGQIAFAAVKSPVLRVAIALLFAMPAAIAGYHATLALPKSACRRRAGAKSFAVVGAIFVGGTAFVRMAVMATPPAAGQHWRGGAGSAADDGRDQTGVKQADPSASPLSGIGVVGRSARPRTSGAALEAR